MINSKRTLYRQTALDQYGTPTTPPPPGASALSIGAMLRLALGMVGSLLLIPFTFWRRRQVPVILQMTTTQCGAACLTMVLRYLGKAVSLTEIADQMDLGRNGATALSIAQSGRHYGLRVRAYSSEPSALAQVAVPAILHWNFSHFVVLEKWHSNNRATIVDPAAGRRVVSSAEFDRCFTGIVLVLEPDTGFQRSRQSRRFVAWRKQIHRILVAGGAWRLGGKALVATVVVQLLALGLPLLTGLLVDHVVPQRQVGLIPLLAGGVAAMVIMQMAVGLVRRLVLIRLQAEVDSGLMRGFLEHLLALPYRFFQQRTSGDLLMRLSSNTMMRELLTTQTITAIMDGVMVIAFLALLLVKAPTFALVAVLIGLAQVILLLASTGRMNDLAQRHLATQTETQSYLVEALAGVNIVKATGTEDLVLKRWSGLHAATLAATIDKQRLTAFFDTLLTGLQMATPLILLLIGVQQVLSGTLSLGMMLALNALATGFLTPLAALVASGQQLQTMGAHLNRMADVLEAEPEIHGAQTPARFGAVELDHVSFHYDRHSTPVLNDINIRIQPGQKVAIVGRSGSGKSTLARLLLGLHQPTTGSVRFDGIPMSDIDRRALRGRMGVVMQEVFLFSGSIRQNITFGQEDLPVEDVLEAIRLACIDRDIAHMPMNLETLVAEGGAGLSGGQRQRLALARALARKPAILLLDEATSHLDTATEYTIEQNLRAVGCTQIVIAHRLSTVRNADIILVMDEGRIVEQGTHAELLAANGTYALLANNQDTEHQATA
ncbi:MAG: peptidase domain-containing ABC transporter [Litorilinea sp.]